MTMNLDTAQRIFSIVQSGHIHDYKFNLKNNIDDMRKFHNYIKNQLILSNNGTTLLDIAVGRGGDLFKWKKAGFKVVIGIDIHEESIKEATRRLKEQLKTTKLPFTKYFTINALDRNLDSYLSNIESNIKFLESGLYDTISCQFAFHYFNNTKDDLEHILKIVSSKLKPNGKFIGTATDGDLAKKILNNGDVNLKLIQLKKINDIFYTFNIASESNSKTYFDIKGISLESYIFKDILVETAKKFNLELVSINSFYDWYLKYPNMISSEEAIISFLNFSFVFQKIN